MPTQQQANRNIYIRVCSHEYSYYHYDLFSVDSIRVDWRWLKTLVKDDSNTAKYLHSRIVCIQEGRRTNPSKGGKSLLREGGRGGTKREVTLLFHRFVVDETHGVLVFDDPFDELPLGEALCGRNAAKRDESQPLWGWPHAGLTSCWCHSRIVNMHIKLAWHKRNWGFVARWLYGSYCY